MRSASGAARSVTRARRAQRANAQTAPRGAGRPRGFRKVERTARGGVSKAILPLLHRPACDQNFSASETSVRRGGGLRHLLDLPRRVDGGRVDFQDLDVVRALKLVVDDPGRLEHAVAGVERVLAVVLVDELHPALQHVEHLEVALVLVEPGGVQVVGAGAVLLDADHVGAELPVSGPLDAEVAVLHEGAQPGLEDGLVRAADAEQLLGRAHRWNSFPRATTSPVAMSMASRRGPIVRMAWKPS